MDNNTLIALLSLICLVVGGCLTVIWGKLSALIQAFNDERVRVATAFITSPELDRRLQQAVDPIEKQLTRIEIQNDKIFGLLTGSTPTVRAQ